MSAMAQRDPELERRNVRTALWLGLLSVGFLLGFVVNLWLR